MRSLTSFIIALGLMMPNAFAAEGDIGTADRQALQSAAEALKARRYDEAIVRLRRLLESTRDPELRIPAQGGLGLAYGERGNRVASAYWWQRFAEETARTDVDRWAKQRAHALEQLAAHRNVLRTSHGLVAVTTSPQDARISLSPRPSWLPPTGARRFYLPAGTHRLTARHPDYEPRSVSLTVAAGDEPTPIHIALSPKPKPVPVAPTVTPGPPSLSAQQIGGWATFGVGVASLVGGGIMTGLTAADHEEAWTIYESAPVSPANRQRFNRLSERIGARAEASYVFYGVASVLVVSGLLLTLLDNGEAAPTQGSGPVSSPGGVSFAF